MTEEGLRAMVLARFVVLFFHETNDIPNNAMRSHNLYLVFKGCFAKKKAPRCCRFIPFFSITPQRERVSCSELDCWHKYVVPLRKNNFERTKERRLFTPKRIGTEIYLTFNFAFVVLNESERHFGSLNTKYPIAPLTGGVIFGSDIRNFAIRSIDDHS